MKTQGQQKLNKIIAIQILFLLCFVSKSLVSQNIAIEKVNGLYKAVNLNIKNDSLNYIPSGKFKPKILNDSIVEIYSYHCVPELSSACGFGFFHFLFTDKKKKLAYYGFSVSVPSSNYYLGADKKCGKWVFKMKYNNKVYLVKEKLTDNPKEFIETVAEKFKKLGIPNLKCTYTVEVE